MWKNDILKSVREEIVDMNVKTTTTKNDCKQDFHKPSFAILCTIDTYVVWLSNAAF